MRRIYTWHVVALLSLAGLLFFYKGLVQGLFPIPSDTLSGLYHPFRDYFAHGFPNGTPFKNFLLTDPVRQIIPWKELSISLIASGHFPLWNPYEMAGKPLFGNFQSSPLYPLNVILFIKPFIYSWSAFIILQQIMAALFMYVYLRGQKISREVSIFGGFIFAFSGFMIAWLEWGTVGHTLIWLPLILLTVEKISRNKVSKKIYVLYVVSLSASLFAGHLQTFIYILIFSFAYFLLRLRDVEKEKKLKKFGEYLILNSLFLILTFVQLLPTLQFILLSARDGDQNFLTPGFLLPQQHLLQFFVPDFFGNPATLNYWGVWNYAEFFGYIGIIPLILALLTVGKRSKNILFFQGVILISLIFAVASPLTEFVYSLNIPFFSSTQPTRLIGIISFSLVTLACFGLSNIPKKMTRRRVLSVTGGALLFAVLLWGAISTNIFEIDAKDIAVTKRNMILPTMLLACAITGVIIFWKFSKKKYIGTGALLFLIVLTIFDLTRTAQKFTPFTPSEYLYPTTKVIEFLKQDKDVFRIASTDDRILAPNIATYYRIQSIEGYDPLYLKNYAKFIALNERQNTDINPPYGYNRIITPRNLDTQFVDFLNVKYILSLSEIDDDTLIKVAEEGQTKVYENTEVFPRIFFVENVAVVENDSGAAEKMLDTDLRRTAVITEDIKETEFHPGTARIQEYSENKIVITTINEGEGFLVLSDAYYPTWKVTVNGEESKIYKVNLAFRGVIIPPGENEIIFYNNLF